MYGKGNTYGKGNVSLTSPPPQKERKWHRGQNEDQQESEGCQEGSSTSVRDRVRFCCVVCDGR